MKFKDEDIEVGGAGDNDVEAMDWLKEGAEDVEKDYYEGADNGDDDDDDDDHFLTDKGMDEWEREKEISGEIAAGADDDDYPDNGDIIDDDENSDEIEVSSFHTKVLHNF